MAHKLGRYIDGKDHTNQYLWLVLHSLADNLAHCANCKVSPDMRAEWGRLMTSLTKLHKCSDCREHLAEELKGDLLKYSTMGEARENLILLHNRVNYRIGKSCLPVEEAIDKQTFLRGINMNELLMDIMTGRAEIVYKSNKSEGGI